MWNLLPTMAVLKVIAGLFTVIFISFVFLFEAQSAYLEYFKYASFASTTTLILVYLVLTKFWQKLWQLQRFNIGQWLNRKVAPNLNGTWQGISKSIKHGEIEVSACIEMDILNFKMKLWSKALQGRSKSTSTSYQLTKDSNTGDFMLSYFYKGTVEDRSAGDDKTYDGAAKLTVEFDDNGAITLKGDYWTNRASQSDQQTAGTIELTRVS